MAHDTPEDPVPHGAAPHGTARQAALHAADVIRAQAGARLELPAAMLRRHLLARESWPAKLTRLLRFSMQRAKEERIAQVASSLTFTSVLSMVPLLAVTLALFTAFPLFAQFKGEMEKFMADKLMPGGVAGNIMQYLNQFAEKATNLTAVGGLFLLITAVSLMLTADKAFNEIWHVRRGRPLVQRVLIYWAALTLGPVLMGASLWATSFVVRTSMGLAGGHHAVLNVVVPLIPLVLTGLTFTALFAVVPNRHVYLKDAAVGGFAAAIVLELMKSGFAFYLTTFPTYTMLYGAFATFPIFLLWVYVSWLVVLFAATLAAGLPLIRMGRWATARPPGAPFVDALAILRTLAGVRDRNPPGLSMQALGSRRNLPDDELMEVLEVLQGLGYVARVTNTGYGHERWAMVCDPDTASLGPVLQRLLLDRIPLETDPDLHAAIERAWADGKVTITEALRQHQADVEAELALDRELAVE